VPNCRFTGWGSRRDHQRLEYDEAHRLCCEECTGTDGCVGFSLETARTTIRATNATMRVAHSCVLTRAHDDLSTTMHERKPYEAAGRARVTRVTSDCYVPPPPSPSPPPEPPNPPDPPSWPPPDPSPVAALTNEEIRQRVDAEREAPMGNQEAEDWWWLLPDMEDNHWDPWMNRTPVPKVRWYATSDAFDRL